MTQTIEGAAGAVSQATPAALATETRLGNGSALRVADLTRLRHELALIRDIIPTATTIDEVVMLRDRAEAIRRLAQLSKGHIELQNAAAENRLRCDRRAGELLADSERGKTGPRLADTASANSQYRDAIQSIGGDEKSAERAAQRWQAVASIPEDRFERHVREVVEKGEELTTAGLLRATGQPHVANNSGENEWYTPKEYVDAARAVLGSIDLDPASSAQANGVVQASRFYSIEDDGLAQKWAGNVWMNPPYAADLIGKFTNKLGDSYGSGSVDSAIALVNNATETVWFQALARHASAICFPERRIRFWSPNGVPGAPLQGQAFLYLGTEPRDFEIVFRAFGLIVSVQDA